MKFIKGDIEKCQVNAKRSIIKNIEKDPMKDVILGIRPEDMEIVNNEQSHIQAMIYSIELTGEQTIVTSKMDSNFITIREDKDYESDLDIPVKIKIDITKTFLFDSISGKKI